MKFINLFLIIIFFYTICCFSSEILFNKIIQNVEKVDTSYIYKDGDIEVFFLLNGRLADSKLFWGNKKNLKNTKEYLTSYKLSHSSYVKSNNRIIVLKSSTGTNSPIFILLPMDTLSKYQE